MLFSTFEDQTRKQNKQGSSETPWLRKNVRRNYCRISRGKDSGRYFFTWASIAPADFPTVIFTHFDDKRWNSIKKGNRYPVSKVKFRDLQNTETFFNVLNDIEGDLECLKYELFQREHKMRRPFYQLMSLVILICDSLIKIIRNTLTLLISGLGFQPIRQLIYNKIGF